MKKLFLIIGAPGSGKTTDAELIAAQHKDISHYSAGEMFRTEVSTNSELGKKIDSYISVGKIVPIDIAIKTILTAIINAPTSTVVIDGYPRSQEQMEELDKYLVNEPLVELMNVIEVEVCEEVACDRVLGRARGADDNVDVFNNRMEVYLEPLATIQEYYSAKNLLTKVNGERSIDDIVTEIDALIQSKI